MVLNEPKAATTTTETTTAAISTARKVKRKDAQMKTRKAVKELSLPASAQGKF